VLRRAFWRLKAARPERWPARARRALLVARARAAAAWHRCELEIDVAPDVLVGRDVRIELARDTTNRIRIGAGSRLGDRVLLRMIGGSVELGRDVEIRRDTVLNLGGGLLEIGDGSILSWSCRVHCAEHVRLEEIVGVAEDVTIADSTHFFTEPDRFFYDNTRTAPISIGTNTWLCPKVTVTSGAKIGSHCIVAAGSVVIDDVPEGHLASGVPISVTRPIKLPWLEER
jgi:acetyltransferase-like isoleucine patch superfamily enzyme